MKHNVVNFCVRDGSRLREYKYRINEIISQAPISRANRQSRGAQINLARPLTKRRVHLFGQN